MKLTVESRKQKAYGTKSIMVMSNLLFSQSGGVKSMIWDSQVRIWIGSANRWYLHLTYHLNPLRIRVSRLGLTKRKKHNMFWATYFHFQLTMSKLTRSRILPYSSSAPSEWVNHFDVTKDISSITQHGPPLDANTHTAFWPSMSTYEYMLVFSLT